MRRAAALLLLVPLLLAACAKGGESPGAAQQAALADAVALEGKQLFRQRCGGCHGLGWDFKGPDLDHVYGRRAGSQGGFKYSAAMSGSNLLWDAATLDKFLAAPQAFLPGTEMKFRGAPADERRLIIAFLQESAVAP
jgi:cytochrome c